MHRGFVQIAVSTALFISTMAVAQDAKEILEMAREKQIERWQGVDIYVVDQTMAGGRASSWFQRFEFENEQGNREATFLPVPATRFQSDQCSLGNLTDEDLDTISAGTEMAGNEMATAIEDGLEDAGLPPQLLSATGSDPWNTMDPRVMLGGYSTFLRAAAEAKREENAVDYSARAATTLDQMSQFIDKARLIGTEVIEGRSAFHLQAKGLAQVQKVEDQEYRIEVMSMWIDTEQAVPLKMRRDGTMTDGSESRPMTIENIQTDYRQVPDSDMFESYRRVMTISGMMDAAEQAQMREAQAQLAEFEKELAGLPASQRQMMEKMMGDRLDMMRNMAKDGAFKSEVVVNQIRVNPPLVDQTGELCQD